MMHCLKNYHETFSFWGSEAMGISHSMSRGRRSGAVRMW